jgi:hypothetical protein
MIARGAILIRSDGRLPETLTGETRPFSPHWSFLTDQPGEQPLEKRLATAGWTSSHRAGPLRRAATGVEPHQMIESALKRLLAGAGLESCNCLEIDEVRMHSLETIRYASVSGRARQLHEETR